MQGNTIYRRAEHGLSKIKKRKLDNTNSVRIFPFDLVMGFITSTENGTTQNNANIYDYSTFQRIFTGLENVLAKWQDAYKVFKKNDNDTFLTKEYKVGRNFRGIIPKEDLAASFSPSPISNDFLAEFSEETFSIKTYEEITEKDLFRLFIIPELQDQKWLYISSATKHYDGNNKFYYSTIELTTINNKIAKSGRAIEEFIQRGAPGEGYAWPNIINEEVVLDLIRNRDVPISSMQVEMGGAAAISTTFAYGRPTIQKNNEGIIEGTFNPKIDAPRLLIPFQMETPIPSPVNTRPTSETDWVAGKFEPTLAADYADWKETIKAKFDTTQRAQYEGILKGNKKDLDASNPVNQGTRNFLMWDNNWKFSVNKTYNTSTDAFTGKELVLNKELKLVELLSHNIFGLSGISSLPMSKEQNIAWSLHSIPLIGGFLNKATIGIPIGWTNTAIKVKMDDILAIIPASLSNYANVLIPSESNLLRIDLNTLTDEQAKNDAIEFSGIKATGSLIKFALTHRFKKTIGGIVYVFDTKDLAQKHPTIDDNGTPITGTLPDKLLWDESCTPTNRGNVAGYVIDIFTMKTIAKTDFRLTFFSNDFQAFSGTFETQSKFTKSIRDWTTSMKLSDWNTEDNKEVNYPQAIVAPDPPDINNPKISIQEFQNKKILLDESNYVIDTNTEPQITINKKTTKNKLWKDTAGKEYFVDLVKTYEDYNAIIKKLEYDTTNIGGINGLKQNYEKLNLNFSYKGINKKIIVDINTLITSGEINTKIPLNKRIDTLNIYFSSIAPYEDIKLNLLTEPTINIKIINNIIKMELRIKVNYEFSRVETIAPAANEFDPGSYEYAPWTIGKKGEKFTPNYDYELLTAILMPKKITTTK